MRQRYFTPLLADIDPLCIKVDIAAALRWLRLSSCSPAKLFLRRDAAGNGSNRSSSRAGHGLDEDGGETTPIDSGWR
jgi:hypothetical protein